MSWDLRRAGSRSITSTDWLHSAHSFAFGAHYDPDNLSFGSLLAFNVDEVRPGPGYPRHRHAGIEILTWVLSGTLQHRDACGERLVRSGSLQYLSVGSGIEHVERSASDTEPVRVVQMWLAAAEPGGEPRYQAVDVPARPGELVLAASGRRPAPVSLRQPAAELFLGRLPAGSTVSLPVAPYLHLFLLSGVASVRDETVRAETGRAETGRAETGRVETARAETGRTETGRVETARAERLAAEDALRLTGEQPAAVTVEQDAKVLVWAMA